MSAEAIARPRPSPQHLDLLLVVSQLLRSDVFKGDKRERLHRAFLGSAVYLGNAIMPELEGRLPTSPKEAALELHQAVIELCMRVGINGRDLVEHYNNVREAASYGLGSVGEAAERSLALLAVFYARDLTDGRNG